MPLKVAAGFCLSIALCIKELRQHARDTAVCVLANKFGKRPFRVVSSQQFVYFDWLCRVFQRGASGSYLEAPNHVAADHGKQRDRIGANVGAELLLEDLEQIAFR